MASVHELFPVSSIAPVVGRLVHCSSCGAHVDVIEIGPPWVAPMLPGLCVLCDARAASAGLAVEWVEPGMEGEPE